MRKRWLCLVLAGVCGPGVMPRAGWAEPPADAARVQEAQKVADTIDRLMAADWAAHHVKPAPLAEDAEFLRRVYLDVAGKIPLAMEVRDFLDDPAPDKRAALVEGLLDSGSYVNHFANVWRTLFIPTSNDQRGQFFLPDFEKWLQERLRKNTPYDELVRELLTASPSRSPNRMARANEPSPAAFYQANALKPENLAAATSRIFLGVKLECAQCHKHPTEPWTRDQFWEFAAFFAGVQQVGIGSGSVLQEVADRRTLKIPGTEKVVAARFLDGSQPRWRLELSGRLALAQWITTRQNRLFARAAVNRMWAHFFGTGLFEPVDAASELNPPSQPELLDELARQFAANQFDLKFLIRAITRSKTYQRSSRATDPSQDDPRRFARMAVKGLTAEQLYDSLARAVGSPQEVGLSDSFDLRGVPSPRAQFLAKFADQHKPTEYRTSILQALALMNGSFIQKAISIEYSATLAAVIDAPFLDTPRRVETLYLATLSRKPRPEESARLVAYVDSGGTKGDPKTALADVFWALLNSAEFILNH